MLFLMRHGERADDACEKNPDEIPEKLEDPHLTQHGKIQAKAAGDKIKEMVTAKNIQKVKVVSSPFVRCLQTAQEVCRRLGVEEIAVDNTLSEMMHHTFYKESPKETIFLTNEDCYKKYVDIPLKKLEKPFPPFPETFPEFANRAIAFFNHYQKDMKEDECYILVSHGYSINFVLEDRHCFDPYKGVDYCCLNAFENGKLVLQQHHEKL